MLRRGRYLTMMSLLLVVCSLPVVSWAQQAKRTPVKLEGNTVVPLRVLARPFSNIYKEPDATKGIVQENVPTFEAYYVYTRPEVKATGTDIKGWYEVGTDNRGTTVGWMKAEDVLEWKQNMSLAYTHPEGRQPVLMFETREALLDLVKAPSDRRKQRAQELYATLKTKQIPPDFPIRSVEPEKAVDLSKQFYLLPILEFAEGGLDQFETRILKLAAAVLGGAGAREQSNVKTNTNYRDEASSGDFENKEILTKLELDIVFVMDLTNSMQPFVDATLNAIKNIALSITKDAATRQSVRFGLWGYRDSVDIPGIEFLTKNFTPSLQLVEAFEKTLQGTKASTVGSQGFDEDVYSGVADAMRQTAWTPEALRIIVLVGDAPAHEPGHPWNYSGQSAQTLRQYADDNAIYILALHEKEPDPRLESAHALAERQFRTLATNKGTSQAAYYSVNAQDVNAFDQATREIAGVLVQTVAEAKQGKTPAAPTSTPGAAEASTAKGIAMSVGRAALVEWIGRQSGAQAPRDIIAWAVDKDLYDASLQSMEVRLLIHKRELDDLRKVLQEVMAAGRKGQISGDDFFTTLQTTASVLARGEQARIRQAKSMVELVPEFLRGLPYKSQLMALSNSLWSGWSADEQDNFLKEVETKIKLYAEIHDTPDRWVQLHQGDGPDEYVYPIALDALP